VALVLLGFILSSCEITVTLPDYDTFQLSYASFSTNYEYQGRSVVCDDTSTQFNYFVSYRGNIDHATVYLVGTHSGRRYVASSFPVQERENQSGSFSGSFSVKSGVAPLSAIMAEENGVEINELSEVREVSPQAIIVIPRNPDIIGYTTLHIDLDTESGLRPLSSDRIPVLNFCN